jgi:Transposase
MAAVMIGVDPHKGSHTAAAIGAAEEPLADVRVRASAAQAEQLVAWAAAWPGRTWAIEGATGLGNLLAQQLAAAGERVLDVQPKVAARVRLLASGNTNKNDPNDARSVAVAALRSPVARQVTAEDHTAVLKVWSKRYRDLGRARTQVACRLHAVLADLIPGGFSREITAGQAAGLLQRIEPSDAIARARRELAAEFLADLRRLDAQMRDTRNRLAVAVRASGSTLTASSASARSSPPPSSAPSARQPGSVTGTGSPLTTAPPRSRSPPASGRSTGSRCAATGASTTPSTWPRSPRSGTPTAPAAPTSTARSPRARPARRPSAASLEDYQACGPLGPWFPGRAGGWPRCRAAVTASFSTATLGAPRPP